MLNEKEDNLCILYSAIHTKNIHLVRDTLRNNNELIRYKNKFGENLLHIAVKCNFGKFVDLLIKSGINIDSTDCCNRTPLHLAIASKNEDMIRCLLAHNASTNIKNLYGKSPFHLAVNFGNLRITELLLKSGADIMDTTSCTYQTSLHIALRNEDEATFKLFVNHYSGNLNVSDVYGETLLHTLARQKSESLAKLLIDRGADVNFINEDNETALHLAIHRRNFNMSKLLMEHNADVNVKNKYGESPLHLAIRCRDLKLVELLFSFNVNVNEYANDGETMLHVAVNYYNLDIVDLLMKHQVEIDKKNVHGLTPFHTAIKIKCMDAAQQLLHHGGVDVNTVAFGKFIQKGESQQFTPLQTAIVQKYFDGVKLLMENGASFNGDREIFLAVKFGCVNIVHLLIQHRANVNATDSSGQSLLYTAMKSRDRDKVEMLLNCGADPKSVNETGGDDSESALHLAVKAKDEKFVKFLLDIGLDVNMCDGNDATALGFAQGNIANLIIASLALMKVNGFFVCKKNESVMSMVQEFGMYFGKCTDELERIRSTRHGNVQLIEFLRNDVTLWGKYVRKGVFDTTIDENSYPTYWEKLLANIDKGLRRWNLIRRVKDTLCEFQCFQPLYDVLDDIVDNINDDELDSFIRCFNEEL